MFEYFASYVPPQYASEGAFPSQKQLVENIPPLFQQESNQISKKSKDI